MLLSYPPQRQITGLDMDDAVMDTSGPWSSGLDAKASVIAPRPQHSLSRDILHSPRLSRSIAIERPCSPVHHRLSSCRMDIDNDKILKESEKWLQKLRTNRSPPTIPVVRSTPTELWQIVTDKLSKSPPCMPVPCFQDQKVSPSSDKGIPPIGSERNRIPEDLDISENSPPQVLVVPVRLRRLSREDDGAATKGAFAKLMIDTWRNNPHAPRVMSQFNPLREQAPWQYWRDVKMLSSRRWNFQKDWFPPIRSRYHCDRYSKEMKPQHYLMGVCRHCADCLKDTLAKKLLIHLHQQQQPSSEQEHKFENGGTTSVVIDINKDVAWATPPPRDENAAGCPDSPFIHDLLEEDFDMPSSPVLRDLDDFESESDSDMMFL